MVRDFEDGLREYEYGVLKILPKIKGDDDSLEDELSFLLWNRDQLEKELKEVGEIAEEQKLKLREFDLKLIKQKEKILRFFVDYKSWRVRNKVPHSHWWWYLDELSEQEIRKLEEKLGKVA